MSAQGLKPTTVFQYLVAAKRDVNHLEATHQMTPEASGRMNAGLLILLRRARRNITPYRQITQEELIRDRMSPADLIRFRGYALAQIRLCLKELRLRRPLLSPHAGAYCRLPGRHKRASDRSHKRIKTWGYHGLCACQKRAIGNQNLLSQDLGTPWRPSAIAHWNGIKTCKRVCPYCRCERPEIHSTIRNFNGEPTAARSAWGVPARMDQGRLAARKPVLFWKSPPVPNDRLPITSIPGTAPADGRIDRSLGANGAKILL